MDAKKVDFLALIRKNFRIPEYQRPYSWGKDNVNSLLESLKENACDTTKDYFMGAVMLQRNKQNVFEIVDGQQRLITISLISKVLEKKIEELNINVITTKGTSLRNLLNVLRDDNGDYRLELLDADNSNFRKILDDENPDPNSIITENYSYIKGQFEGLDESKISDYAKAMINLQFIEVLLDTEDDPFQMFDTMNSLGMALSFFDLVKNKMVSKDLTLAKDWQDYFDNKRDNFWREKKHIGSYVKAHTEHFLNFYTITHCADDKSSEKDRRKIYRKDLEQIPIKNEFNRFIKHAGIYRNIIECKNDYGNEFCLLSNVMNITEQYAFTPVVFEIIIKNENNKAEVLTKITNYIVRQYICSRDTKGLNKNIVSLSKDIGKLKNVKGDITPVEDNEISVALSNRVFNNNKKAKNILLLIEQKIKGNVFNFANGNISLEHISAVKSNDNINEIDKLKIGNLMLLDLTDNIKAGTNEYKSKLSVNYQGWAQNMSTYFLDGIESWGEDAINERTNQIINLIIKTYPKAFKD